ncbi:MAG: recombination protein O N-terminal domain-containing protein [bacterium]|nr:recombination protein O N-terminal domain-containing protein [bacterium]
MYQKYQTDALVLGGRESGEADRTFALYTRDFGLVRARATAVRSEKSKMRYALQNYARAHVSLVKGKRGWRLAGAVALSGVQDKDRKAVASFARISELVSRLVHGEEKNEYLFSALADAHNAFMVEKCEAVATIEIVCVARVLYALGYISTEALETALFTHTAYTGEHLLEAETMKDKLLFSINRAIAETHL